jgi:glucans biosynthesis protein C
MKQMIPAAILNIGAGSWGFLYYLWFLIAGFIIVSSDRLQKLIQNQCWIFLSLGVILSTTILYSLFSPSHMVPPAWIDPCVHPLIYFFSAWCWIFAILGFGMRFLAFDRPFLRTTNEGVLPFYVLHQSVLVGFGFFVMRWKIDDFSKWAIVFTGSFMMILAIYSLLVRKLDLLRFLFGMKTSHPDDYPLRKGWALIIPHALYIGLIVFAISGVSIDRTPMPLRYDPSKDILLDSHSIAVRSPTGVAVVDDPKASIRKAIEFSAGANMRAESHPQVYVEMRFSAPAGLYTVWIRGKSNLDDRTDSVWFQVDPWIGARAGGLCLGNWLDIHPAGIYTWAGNGYTPSKIELKHTGDHRIRIQPRQIPHRIDQIWLSRHQHRIPDTFQPLNP